jgi:hypothetical protein
VVAAAATAGLWPVVALGILWLRTEVLARRPPAPGPARGPRAAFGPVEHRPAGEPVRAHPAARRPAGARPPGPAGEPVRTIHLTPDPSTAHRPRPRSRSRLVDVAFRLEIAVVVVVVAVLLGGWVGEELDAFDRRTDATLCRLLEDRC